MFTFFLLYTFIIDLNFIKGKKNEIQCPNKECDYKEE